MTPLTLSGTSNPGSYYPSHMFPATVAQSLVLSQRLFVRAVIQRPTTSDTVVLGIIRSDGQAGYLMSAQTDGHCLLIRQNNGGTTTIATATVTGTVAAGYYVMEFTIIPNNGTNGNNIYANFLGEVQTFQFDGTYDVTAGTWNVFVGAASVGAGIAIGYSTGIN